MPAPTLSPRRLRRVVYSKMPDWWPELRRRVQIHRPLKIGGTTVFITAFFVAYFALLRNPLFTPATMPVTAVDRWLEFHPETLILYVSLWVYVPLAPALLLRRDELWEYARAAFALCVTGLGIFLLLPTQIATPDIDWTRHGGFEFLQRVDAAGNACPSMHAAFAVFSAFWLERTLRFVRAPRALRVFNVAWCAAIVYSTLATKQHVVTDAIGGALLGSAIALLPWRRARLVRRPDTGDPPSPPTILFEDARVVVQPVIDLERARAFYEGILGLKPGAPHKPGSLQAIDYPVGARILRIALSPSPPACSQNTAAALELDDFEATVAGLRSRGACFALDPAAAPDGWMATVLDPDENRLILYCEKSVIAQ